MLKEGKEGIEERIKYRRKGRRISNEKTVGGGRPEKRGRNERKIVLR